MQDIVLLIVAFILCLFFVILSWKTESKYKKEMKEEERWMFGDKKNRGTVK